MGKDNEVKDVIPLFHTPVVGSMLDAAFHMIQDLWLDDRPGMSIIGVYYAP